MNLEELKSVADKYGSPTYVFDIKALKERIEKIRHIIGDKVGLVYSIKANPFLTKDIIDLVDGLEVCSPGELELCAKYNIDPSKIIYSGVCKTEKDVIRALEYGVGIDKEQRSIATFTAESLRQVEYIQKNAKQKVNLIPRLNGGNQFGMSKEELFYLIDNRDKYDKIEIKGIHFFTGTQKKHARKQLKELDKLTEILEIIEKEHGFKMERVEYGPGARVPIFAEDDNTNSYESLEEISEALKAFASKGYELTIEMGRFIATECGYYLTSIVDMKTNKDIDYAFIDGGLNHVNYYGQMMGMKLPVVANLNTKEFISSLEDVHENATKKAYCLYGSLCTTNDVIVSQLPLQLNMGDVLAFSNMGAYSITEGIYLFLSRTLPRVVLWDGSAKLVRDYIESYEINSMNAVPLRS